MSENEKRIILELQPGLFAIMPYGEFRIDALTESGPLPKAEYWDGKQWREFCAE